jgi:heptosyltransferase-2
MTEPYIKKLNQHGFQQTVHHDWTGVYARDLGPEDPVQYIQTHVQDLTDSNAARGGRFTRIAPEDDQEWFIKQYHHGGLLAGQGDVLYPSPDRFLEELLGTEMARAHDIPVPRPLGVFWNETTDGYKGFYVSSWLDAVPATRKLREGNVPDLMHRSGTYLARLHNAEIDHQDYKLDNLLLDENEDLYITDFDPVQLESLSTFSREQRLHRFLRFLSKYGFSNCDESAFVDGYRATANRSSSIVFSMLGLPNWIRNTGSDLIKQFSRSPLQPVDLEHVVVRAPNWLGDCVMSLPFLQTLSDQLPSGSVDVVCRQKVTDIFHASLAVEQVWPLDNDKTTHFPDPVGNERYSLAIVLPKSFRTALQAWRTGIPRRLGFSTGLRRMLLSDPVPLDGKDRILHHAQLYAQLLPDPLEQPDKLPDVNLTIPDNWKSNTPESWYSGNTITVHPGSAYGPAKRWPPERFQRFLQRVLNRKDVDITFLGVSSEREMADEILEGLPSERINDLVGKTSLKQCMVVLDHSRATVANDSGLMHLSAGLGTPVVALFGSSSPELTFPLGPGHEVIYQDVECSPCFERTCPRDQDRYKCLTQITPEMVYDRLTSLLSENS